ncbi:MAG: PadR family transcriptional regulator [Solirubrobacterales bacterium]|nr:PadR family transcriptional regulator [Solirubrobacterales bacterium]
MSSVRLGPTSYVVLGSIALRGPSTSYDLKRFVEVTLGHFWSFPHSQLYAEPDRLARAGLLSENREQDGRRKRTYTITGAGRDALDAWLREPTLAQPEIRDPGLLKVFFSELTGEDEFQALVREQAAIHRATLASYESLWQRYSERTEYAHRMLPLRWGLRMERGLVAFWEELADEHSAAPAHIAAQPAPR